MDDTDVKLWTSFSPTEHAVVLYVLNGPDILLINKKRGLGEGKVNGPGGRLEVGETAAQAAIRETREEVGLETSGLAEIALLQFEFTSGYRLEVTVFTCQTYAGELIETDEAKPFWCKVSDIPYDQMWADDIVWLPRALAGDCVFGQFTFDDDVMLDSFVVSRDCA